ncbi:NAD(P)-binding protein [Cadophora sp. DSE1049]|nr:NAD(P)-binding protein [Cadophora sp. DSE1049]
MENLPVDFFVTSQAFTKSTSRDVYPAIDPTSSSNSQAGKVIVITGASKGLGRIAFAASFARASPKAIVLVARTAESLTAAAKEIHNINSNIEVLTVPTDLLSPESVSALWEKVKAKFRHADVLVNNAGTLAGGGALSDANPGAWWSDFEVNGRGTFLITQGFLQLLGKEKKGSVINLTTGAAVSTFPGISSYAISKLIHIQLAAYIAVENPNVTAVALHPGTVHTDMTLDSFVRFSLDTPELVGGVGVWLATDKAAFLTGKYVSANWDVEELVERKDEITGGKLSVALVGDFGQEQFA